MRHFHHSLEGCGCGSGCLQRHQEALEGDLAYAVGRNEQERLAKGRHQPKRRPSSQTPASGHAPPDHQGRHLGVACRCNQAVKHPPLNDPELSRRCLGDGVWAFEAVLSDVEGLDLSAKEPGHRICRQEHRPCRGAVVDSRDHPYPVLTLQASPFRRTSKRPAGVGTRRPSGKPS
jgi:hypothetical protein